MLKSSLSYLEPLNIHAIPYIHPNVKKKKTNTLFLMFILILSKKCQMGSLCG